MYNSMYPSHMVIPFNTQTTQLEGRRFPSRPQLMDIFQFMNFDVPPIRRREMGYQYRAQAQAPGMVSPSVPPPPHLNCRPVLSNSGAEYWNSRISNGKSTKLRHGVSAPCLKSAVRDDSSDSGLSSRSPTPNRQSSDQVNSLDGSSEESLSDETIKNNRRVQELAGQVYLQHIHNGRVHSYQQHRNTDQPNQNYSKRRNNASRYPNNRGRRVTGMIPTPFPSSTQFTTAPDRFLTRAHLMQVRRAPEKLTDGSPWDQLSRSVWRKFIQNQQTEDTFRKKMFLWKHMYMYIKSFYPKYGLYLVGSTMTGFGSNQSDVDMCLLVRHSEIDQRNEAVSYLGDILRILHHCDFVQNPELILAKVPILKFHDGSQGLEVDLNCNNAVGIRNTHLLYCYSQLDWRVRPLVLVVKLWAHCHNINDAKNMTISSYSLALMVIHFLQYGVHPPILPCLHSLYREKFLPTSDINTIDIHEEINPSFRTENTRTLGELLLQFFQYFTNFDYSQNAVSVRLANVIPIEECRHTRTAKNDPHQWKYLCIEEPFDLTNTARSVYDPEVFEHIRTVISKSAHLLMENRTLESIFSAYSSM